jgi:hypothetical protein
MTRWNHLPEKKAKELGIEIEVEEKESKRKYNNEKPEVDGVVFDSRKEANYYCNLKLRKRAGDIKDFELQPKFVLLEKDKDRVTGRGIKYIADFKITYSDGSVEVVDVKGYKTQVYKLKKKLLLKKYPDINFREV